MRLVPQTPRSSLPGSARTTYPCHVEVGPQDSESGAPDETATAMASPVPRQRSALRWLRTVNRSPGLVSFIHRARRLLPGDPEFGDPLSTAGEGGPRAAARAADRLLRDRDAASREVGLSVLQVWQALTEAVSRRPANPEVTLVFTDLVGFSTWSLHAGGGCVNPCLPASPPAFRPTWRSIASRLLASRQLPITSMR